MSKKKTLRFCPLACRKLMSPFGVVNTGATEGIHRRSKAKLTAHDHEQFRPQISARSLHGAHRRSPQPERIPASRFPAARSTHIVVSPHATGQRGAPPRFADASLRKTPQESDPFPRTAGGRANRARDGGSPSRGERAGIWGARGGMRECFGLALLKKIWPPEMAM